MPPRTASLSAIAVNSWQACLRRDGTSTRGGLRAWLLAAGWAIALIATGGASLARQRAFVAWRCAERVESLKTVMNATRTTLSEVLWRWQRGIARALLLTGALAGMALGTVAYAQIVYKNASSATALAAPPNPAASSATIAGAAGTPTITHINAGGVATREGCGNISPAIPGGNVDDLLIALVNVRENGATVATPGGWNFLYSDTHTAGGAELQVFIFYRIATGSDALTVAQSGTCSSMAGRVSRFRNVDKDQPFLNVPIPAANVVMQVSNNIDTGTETTVHPIAMVLVASFVNDNNTITEAGGWNVSFESPLNLNRDLALNLHYQLQTTAGAKSISDWSISASDANIGIIFSLRPAGLRIVKPAGTVAGDVLVASIGFRPSCCDTPAANYGITAPSGWTALPRLDNAPGAGVVPSNSLAVYWKVAGASEPAAYQWSFSTSGGATFDAAAGGILTFSGVEAVAPVIGVEENGRQTTASDQTTPSITAPAANTILVTSHSYASPTTAPWTAPSGMTTAVDNKAGAQSTAIFYGVQAVAGPTGTKQAVPTPDDDIGNAHILALRSATPGTALTIPIPTGTVANDVMIAAITVRGADRSITPPLGWDEVRRTEQTTGTANLQVFYVRAAGGSEPASYTWTLAATNTGAVGGILSFSGVDTTAPIVANAIDNHGGNLSPGTGGAVTANSINTNVSGTVAVSAHSFVSADNWSPAAPVDVPSRTVPNVVGISLAMYHYAAQASPGPTGDKTATALNDSDTGIGQILALKPAPPPAPAVGGFNAYETSTAGGAITGVIKTKIAGGATSLDIIALNPAKNAILTNFTGTVRVEVLDASNNTGALDGNGCRATWTVIQTLSPDPAFIAGDNGRKTISFTQANSFPDARLRITYPAGAPTVTGCSNDNFAIRPNTLASFAVTDTDWQTAGTARTLNDVTFGTVTHKAGRTLSVRATAVNTAAATTTNYVGAPTATLSACGSAACTATFGTMSLGASFVAGQLASDVASYDNIGSFQLELVDSSFASVDAGAGDSSALEREIRSGTIDVGRFVPDHFAVALNTPAFGTACGAGFTYVGQAFDYTTAPVIIVTARNFANNTTTLYEDNWWRITNATLTGKSYAAATGALDVSGLPGTDPTVFAAGAGTGTLTFSSGTGIFFDRTTPVAPFDADISLAINVIDADGVAYASNPARFGQPAPGNGIAFDNAKEMRFGQLAISNAYGSQLVPLQLRMEVQHWNGTAFVTNTDDDCTSLAATNFEMRDFTQNLAACETSLTVGAFSNGRATAQLSGPGSSNTGGVFLIPRLDSSVSGAPQTCIAGTLQPVVGANRPYLQAKWDSTDEDSDGLMFDDDPESQATFGTYRGAEEVIFIRENF